MKHEILGQRRESRFVKDIGRLIEEDTKRLEREGKLFSEEPHAEGQKPLIVSGSGYVLMDYTKTYALGVHALREACNNDLECMQPKFVKKDGSVVYRPLTIEENIRTRLDDYNTLENPDGSKRGDEERKRLFNAWLDSCTGIAYKKGSTLFKIITESEDLIGIPQNFSDPYIPANYSQLLDAEFDSRKGKYNQTLALDEVLEHPAWNAAVADRQLLKDYAELVFRMKDGNNMGFWVRRNTSQDELRALCVLNISSSSDAGGDNLYNIGRFVRATHRAP